MGVAAKKSEVVQVYLLYFYVTSDKDRTKATTKTRALPFSTIARLKSHLATMVMKQIGRYDDIFASKLSRLYEQKNYDEFISVWRTAKVENSRNTGFEAYWEDEPQVLM